MNLDAMNSGAMAQESIIHLASKVVDEGQECFVVTTPTATYYYQKEGCGFSSLVDRDGNDWINYNLSEGADGSYRGIPNMGFKSFGHPGFTYGAKSWISEQRPDYVKITSESADKTWRVNWEFYPDHAAMTAEHIGKRAWLLYEGTPGGSFRPEEQYWLSSDGQKHPCDIKFRGCLPTPKWVAFCDPRSDRSLILSYEGEATKKDVYWPMKGKKQEGMTVFGFGRSDFILPRMHLRQTQFKFTFALVETLEYRAIQSAYNRF